MQLYKYHCMNPISEKGLSDFSRQYVPSDISHADVVLVRSRQIGEEELSPALLAIARAGAGVNNIPVEACTEKGIVVFNTPGANANAVKELVLAGMLLAARDITGGIDWVKAHAGESGIAKLAEQEKKNFAGSEIAGKRLGVIGLGAIGILVANAARRLGMEVYGYDPYVSVDGAWKLSGDIRHAETVEEICKECDYITVHVPAMDGTRGMISEKTINCMKRGVVVLNFSRDSLVDEFAMKEALLSGQVKRYVTDFPNELMAGTKGAVVIPHLGASTAEAEDNCAAMAVRELMDYLEHGSISHSVNYPDCSLGRKGKHPRIIILHRNVPNMIGQFAALLAQEHVNIVNMTNKSRGGYACTMMDIEAEMLRKFEEDIKKIDGVLRIRIIA